MHVLKAPRLAFLLILALAIGDGCGMGEPAVPDAPPAPASPFAPKSHVAIVSRLRVQNVGSIAVRQLVVSLVTDRLRFGDVAAGATTGFLDAPTGVFGYAAFHYWWDGRTIIQPVIDWIDSPLPGGAYMYRIRLEPNGYGMEVKLADVLRDQEIKLSKPSIPAPGIGDR
jgi:hypothetical protein